MITFEEQPNGFMRVSVSPELREELRKSKEDSESGFGSDQFEHEVMADAFCNSDYDWIRPEECGDLTDAPMFGLRGSEIPVPTGLDRHQRNKLHITGYNSETDFGTFQPVIKRWAFMDYALWSFCELFVDKGYADFQPGHELDPMAVLADLEEHTDAMKCSRNVAAMAGKPEPKTAEEFLHYMKGMVDSLEILPEAMGNLTYEIECLESLGVKAAE